ncbi:MAG: phage tail protein, partial [Geminicoccaceae bacterium]|nr:phage tail protein [Geminicoccaceae bacterium]
WRRLRLDADRFRSRYGVEPPESAKGEGAPPIAVLESVQPVADGYHYVAVRELPDGDDGLLAEGQFASSPFISFRWMKAPGEGYGRSPVMKALPDIKTANKVVELVLKNASIAVTGIWQADDDGVLNPAAVKLVPGAIIPKAVGSAGLAPLEAPGRFDVSELVLSDLRARIRHALLVDRLGLVQGPRMTATEVLERAAEMARVLGATYGRLQAELLEPLVGRGLAILRRRGEIGDIRVDGRVIALRYRSPLAEAQRRADAQSALQWIQTVAALGPEAMAAVDLPAFARWFGEQMAVPGELIKPLPPPDPLGVQALGVAPLGLETMVAALEPVQAGMTGHDG